MTSTEEPETKHLSAQALRAQLAKFRAREVTRDASCEPPTRTYERAGTATRIVIEQLRSESISTSDARTATQLDVEALGVVPSPHRGARALPLTTREGAERELPTDTVLGAAHAAKAPCAAERASPARGTSRRVRGFLEHALRGVLSIAALAAVLTFAARLRTSSFRANEQVDRGALDRPAGTAASASDAGPLPTTPAQSAARPTQALSRPAVASGVVTSSPSVRGAVDSLMSGQTRAALDTYRALASVEGAPPVYRMLVEQLEREVRECEQRGGDACAQ